MAPRPAPVCSHAGSFIQNKQKWPLARTKRDARDPRLTRFTNRADKAVNYWNVNRRGRGRWSSGRTLRRRRCLRDRKKCVKEMTWTQMSAPNYYYLQKLHEIRARLCVQVQAAVSPDMRLWEDATFCRIFCKHALSNHNYSPLIIEYFYKHVDLHRELGGPCGWAFLVW